MMSQDLDDDVVIVARVRLSLVDGSEEAWLVPMRLADDALSYRAEIFPPEGAVIVSVEPVKRPRDAREELVIARAEITTL
jgi:hypothetical protein